MIQQGRPTVGDTVTIVRRFAARPGVVVDARPPLDSAIATLVSPPVLTREGDSVEVAYTIAVWTAGHNDLVLPGAVLIDPKGHIDTLPDAHVLLDVATVLPATQSVNKIPPRAVRSWLPHADRSLQPFGVLLPIALALVVLLQWRWRRRGPPAMEWPAAAPTTIGLTDARVGAWLAAGEARLVLEHLDALARERADLDDWRARVAIARFGPGNDAAAAALVAEAWPRLAEPQP
jgi:hypothetical protein